MLEQPQAGLIGRFYRQVENRPKNGCGEELDVKKLKIPIAWPKYIT